MILAPIAIYLSVGFVFTLYAVSDRYSPKTPPRIVALCDLFAVVGYGFLWLPCLIFQGYCRGK